MSSGKYQADLRRAEVLFDSGELNPAKKLLNRIAQQMPDHPGIFRLLGFIAGQQRDFPDAVKHLERTVQLAPDFVEGWYYLGKSFFELKKFDEAVKSYATAIQLYPQFFEALHDRGLALLALSHLDEAIQSFEAACAIDPASPQLWINLGIVFGKKRSFDREIACYERALTLKPNDLTALTNRGIALCQNRQYSEAVLACQHVLSFESNAAESVRGYLVNAKLMMADWSDLERQLALLRTEIRDTGKYISPFTLLAISHSPQEQLTVAQRYAADLYPPSTTRLFPSTAYRHDRIRLAYLSADYHSHATVFLMLELFNKHDRNRFEVIAISFGPDEDSPLRKELIASFDRFIDVRAKNDHQVALLLRELEIDIAIDLKGYTEAARPGILAYRPAPIQVNYLGYPGTMGVDYIDYLVADRFVVPAADEQFYSESMVLLPDSYQVNGSNRPVDQRPSRTACGLPDQGFVFCSFNNTYKNNPATFNIWMNLLTQVDGSVLWLLAGNSHFEENIRTEAAARGVDSTRIVFAKNEPLAKHLARMSLADLFLDSLPYSAHTTASDALWVNVPVVTCVGQTFPGRVGQSVLHAIDMPELVTHTLDEYEQLALKLATDGTALSAVREKLRRNIKTAPLFDAARFASHLELAYEEMWQCHLRGEAPKRIVVPALTQR